MMRRWASVDCRLLALTCLKRLYTRCCSSDARTASFGFREVGEEDKARLVGDVFSSVAPSYDLMNDLMSVGLHRLWKDRLVAKLQPFAGMHHMDVAGGTGDVAFRVLRDMAADAARDPTSDAGAAPAQDGAGEWRAGGVTVCDINPAMLEEGRRRAASGGHEAGLRWVVGDAEQLPLPARSVDGYTIAFGIRNVTRIDAALAEAFRVLKPGGQFLCLEFSQLVLPGLRELYDAYSFNVIPQIGRVVARDEASYQYLVESIRRFPPQDDFAEQVRCAGFAGVAYENLSGGVCAIHSGFKL
ncbi:hypothetical protein WJX81_001078 [Elliptochloris bilobata]|uniref:2-methoxy-6-polyprenyl-1,4-benzoquinol methylase, mitochondrial n=1 Tax=Elliptochloris bilobata TaxID=381761 RepID=A0AAW1RWU9_9CHLO